MVKRFASLMVLLELLSFTVAPYAQIHISGPQNGTLIDTVYIVDGDISISTGNSLIIEPGATFLFNDSCGFNIQGYLYAVGREQDSIVFIRNQGAVGWNGIDFENTASDSCKMGYCLITGSVDVGIYITACNPTISHCTISNNSGGDGWGGGIRCVISSPTFSNCIISGNVAGLGGGIGCFPGGKPYFIDCLIFNNWGHEGGGIHVELNSTPTFNRCIITRNHSVHRGGGACVIVSSSLKIINCTIYGNSCQEPLGGGICIFSSAKLEMVNSIIARNSNGGVFGGSPPGCGESIRYCDFYDNEGGNFLGTLPDSIGMVVTTNANRDSCDIFQNIFLNPLFVNANTGNFRLLNDSPCIDAGDPRSRHDPDNTVADIGACYFNQVRAMSLDENFEQPLQFGVLTNYPNPFNTSTQISYSLPNTSQIELTISNIQGQRVVTLINGFQEAGTHHITWDAREVASGIYFARLQSGQQVKTIKMVLLK